MNPGDNSAGGGGRSPLARLSDSVNRISEVLLFVLMMLMIAIKKQGGLAITLVVFLIVVINAGATNPLLYTIERVVGTLIGIGVALFINWLPILNKIGKRLGHVEISPVSPASSNMEKTKLELPEKC